MVKKKSKLSYDGRQLMTRIPKDIEREAQLEKGDELIWTANGTKMRVKKDDK